MTIWKLIFEALNQEKENGVVAGAQALNRQVVEFLALDDTRNERSMVAMTS